jgi:hypothetical protein
LQHLFDRAKNAQFGQPAGCRLQYQLVEPQWGDQIGDIMAGILVVGVGVDYNISPQTQAGIKAALKGTGQSLVAAMANDVVDAQLAATTAVSSLLPSSITSVSIW